MRVPELSADADADPPVADATPDERPARRDLTARMPAVILSVAVAAFAAMLAVTGFLGFYVRPTSDDWCMAMKERDWGVRGIVHQYYFHLNGRIANAFMSGVVYMGGGWVTRLFPTLLYVGLAIGTAWLAYLLFARVGRRGPASMLAALAAGVGVSMVTAWGAHSPYVVVYWSAGTISHTLPSVLTLLVVAAALTFRGRWMAWAAVMLVVGFFDATLSETFVFTCGTILAVLLAYRLLFGPRWDRTVRLTVAGLAGLLIGILVLYTSPGAVDRRQVLSTSSLSAPAAVRRAGGILPHVLKLSFNSRVLVPAIALGVLLGLLLPTLPLSRRAFGWIVASCVVLPFVMTFEVITLLGVAYGYNGWAFARVWQDFLIPSTLAIVFGTYLVVAAVVPRVHVSPAVATAAALVPLGFVLYAVGAHALVARTLATHMVARAAAWDAEAGRIHGEVASGATVVTYTPLHIAGLAEPLQRTVAGGRFAPKAWSKDDIGQCAATYFRVDRLVLPAALGGP